MVLKAVVAWAVSTWIQAGRGKEFFPIEVDLHVLAREFRSVGRPYGLVGVEVGRPHFFPFKNERIIPNFLDKLKILIYLLSFYLLY